jgi:hypothetical protein
MRFAMMYALTSPKSANALFTKGVDIALSSGISPDIMNYRNETPLMRVLALESVGTAFTRYQSSSVEQVNCVIRLLQAGNLQVYRVSPIRRSSDYIAKCAGFNCC